MEVARVMFALIRYEIGGLAISDEIKNLITRDTVVALYNLSKKHDLAHLVGDALDKNGFLEQKMPKKPFLVYIL